MVVPWKNDKMPSNLTVQSPIQNVTVDTPNLGFSFPTSLPSRRSLALMYHEYERLKTFEGWPVTFIGPRAMAEAGFFYTKRQDIVRCPFCDIEVMSWEEGDNPREDHRKWNPTCRFVVNEAESGNIRMPLDQHNISWSNPLPTPSGYDTCGPYDVLGMDLPQSRKHILNSCGSEPFGKGVSSIYETKTLSFPQYASLESRLKSFASWPVSLKIKPKVLSEAGFYYTGKGDQTICFYCGGGLKDWEDSDDPWTEHAKWFSACTYVLLVKGGPFVNNAKDSVTPLGKKSDLPELSVAAKNDEAPVQIENLPDILKTDNISIGASTSASSSDTGINDAMLCKVCYSKGLEVVFLPCGHLMSCIECSLNLKTCGVCRKPITRVIRTFLS